MEALPSLMNTYSFGKRLHIEPSFSLFDSTIHYLLLSACSEAVPGRPGIPVLYTRPCGVPSLWPEPSLRKVSVRPLGAHLRRKFQARP